MTTSTTDAPTAVQPDFHPNNIVDHPGSTWAGIGVAFGGVVMSVIQANGIPNSIGTWVLFIGSVLTGVAGMLGK